MVDLGFGLVELGREWGFRHRKVPDERAAHQLLGTAVECGIRLFDTAPSYGTSEERLGRFLKDLDRETRERLLVATKCGEQFDEVTGSVVNHSVPALRQSIERSMSLLGPIAILQIHKATRAVIEDDAVCALLEEMLGEGVGEIGASVTSLDAVAAAVRSPVISVIQFPYNRRHPDLAPAFAIAKAAGKKILVNRPLGEGSLLYDPGSRTAVEAVDAALTFVLDLDFDGCILIGTKNPAHLAEDVRIFHQVIARRCGSAPR